MERAIEKQIQQQWKNELGASRAKVDLTKGGAFETLERFLERFLKQDLKILYNAGWITSSLKFSKGD